MDLKFWIMMAAVLITPPLLAVFFLRLKKTQDEIKALIEKRFGNEVIIKRDPLALHIAQESFGYSQSRGNGNLILTDKELFFAMTAPKKINIIPLNQITAIGRTRRMGGKSILRELLKISFTDDAGKADALAFHVKELESWERELNSRI